ncbi:double-cubane-cluster-containing anaerobic reductase [Pseudoflavonifractor hominis]|uniref:2-hydroxyacyl-CoA dehydratase n=1 Tax=Pseudoflavonifractor hominis TaxID=2763059 RepID=A0ABR7HVN6_9FIRM|nr:double-cubane-cluster-containing anaerobic reductase [Pseudoflavonifractor hominis]MBC5731569.1 2-hydroxyacyl-CoA dehydratase [Pseudoflavonifractor hominis]
MEKNALRLPAGFESYQEARQAGFLRMKQLKELGARVIGLFCSYVPIELVYAAGAIPVGLCASSEEPIAAAEANLPRNLCPLIKASYGFALTDTCPYFYFSDLVVAETTCDGKKKMFELLGEIKETYVMQLPHSRDAAALAFWKEQIIAFQKKLEDFYGITITEEDIRAAIRRKNRERDVMLRYLELGKLNPAPISGYEMGTQIDVGSFSFDLEERCKNVEARTAQVLADWEANYKGKQSDRPRLLLTGCPNAGVREKIIRTVEEMGADVVAFDTCSGTREKVEKVDESNPDVYEALARKYLNINCSVMSPNDSRRGYIGEMIDEYAIDGVLEIILQSCHTYDVESYFIKRFVTQEKGLPYLNIETDYSQSDKGQINTRLAAFLETIEK